MISVEKNFATSVEFRCWIPFYTPRIMVIISDVSDRPYTFVDSVFLKLSRFGSNFFPVSILSRPFYRLSGKFLWEALFMYMLFCTLLLEKKNRLPNDNFACRSDVLKNLILSIIPNVLECLAIMLYICSHN